MGVCFEALGVSLSKTAPGADLGGSSKYSHEGFADRSGERLHVNNSVPVGTDTPLSLFCSLVAR